VDPNGNFWSTGYDVFLRDLTGTPVTTLVSRSSTDPLQTADYGSDSPQISRDGSTVVFVSGGSDLVSGVVDGNGSGSDLFAFDIASSSLTAINLIPAGTHTGNTPVDSRFSLSDNGQIIAFSSYATDLHPLKTDSSWDVFVRDLSQTFSGLELISVNDLGEKADSQAYRPQMDGNGTFVSFESYASNLTPLPTLGVNQLYVRNRTGNSTHLVSINNDGSAGANSNITDSRLSRDGLTISFVSYASDLDATVTDANGIEDVFLRDWQSSTPTTRLVSRDASGNQSANAVSWQPILSDDGSTLSFQSQATDLTSGFFDANGNGVDSFAFNGTGVELISAKASGNFTSQYGVDIEFDINDTGELIAFTTSSNGLVDGIEGNGLTHVYVHDLATSQSELVSRSTTGTPGDNASYSPSISGNGRYVAFESYAQLVPIDTNPATTDIYVRDRVSATTSLISLNAAETSVGDNYSSAPVISRDGSTVAFVSYSSDLDGSITDSNATQDVFVRNWQAASPATRLVSRKAGDTTSGNGFSIQPALSATGATITFASQATDLVSGFFDANGIDFDVFSDADGAVHLVSQKGNGRYTAQYGVDADFDVSDSGQHIAFSAYSNGITDGVVGNGVTQVYIRDQSTGKTELVTVAQAGGPGDNLSYSPKISGDGRYVAFQSFAQLNPLDTNGTILDVYVRDQATSTIHLVSINAAGTNAGNDWSYAPSISRDGSTVAFESYASDLDANVFDASGRDIFLRKWKSPNPVTDLISRESTGVSSANNESYFPILSDNGLTMVFLALGTDLTSSTDSNQSADIFAVKASALSIQTLDTVKLEGDSGLLDYTFVVERSWFTDSALTVDWTVVGTGAESTDANDFGGVFPQGQISFAPGETSKVLTVQVSGDMDVEFDETFIARLTESSNNSQIIQGTAIGTVLNNDIDLEIEASQSSLSEGNTGTKSFEYVVRRLGYTGIVTTVSWSVGGATTSPADANDFGGAFPSGNIEWNVGETEKTFSISVSGDTLVELNESFSVSLSNPSTNAEIAFGFVTNQITNDDSASVALVGVSANESTGKLDFTLTLTNPVDTDVSVDFSTLASGTATVGVDFTGITDQSVTFTAGSTATKTVSVSVTDENLVELDETVAATIAALVASGRNVAIGTSNATGTISNDDSASIALVGVSADESTGKLDFTLTLTNPVDTDVSVDFSTLASGTATVGVDFTGITEQSVTFTAGTTTSKVISVTVLDDLWVETDETVNAQLSGLAAFDRNVQLGIDTAAGTILNDDIVKVVHRAVYYRGSSFAVAGGVEAAIDTSKTLARAGVLGQVLSYENLINTSRGINGLVFDVAGLEATSLTASDFVFRMSPTGAFANSTTPPSSWENAPAPLAIVVTPGTANTPSRVRIDWTDNLIANRWLQVKILANANTGLINPDVYYLGHLLGETNGAIESGSFTVRTQDVGLLVAEIGKAAPVTSRFDINKDGLIRTLDAGLSAGQIGRRLTQITIPPAGSGDEGEGILQDRVHIANLSTGNNARDLEENENYDTQMIRPRWTNEVFDVQMATSSFSAMTPSLPSLAAWIEMNNATADREKDGVANVDSYFAELAGQYDLDLNPVH
jgi:hypothetical protein